MQSNRIENFNFTAVDVVRRRAGAVFLAAGFLAAGGVAAATRAGLGMGGGLALGGVTRGFAGVSRIVWSGCFLVEAAAGGTPALAGLSARFEPRGARTAAMSSCTISRELAQRSCGRTAVARRMTAASAGVRRDRSSWPWTCAVMTS